MLRKMRKLKFKHNKSDERLWPYQNSIVGFQMEAAEEYCMLFTIIQIYFHMQYVCFEVSVTLLSQRMMYWILLHRYVTTEALKLQTSKHYNSLLLFERMH